MKKNRSSSSKKEQSLARKMTHSNLNAKSSQPDQSNSSKTVLPSKDAHNPFQFSSLPLQAKLTVGSADDKYEQEADQVAARVVQQINAPASVQRDSAENHSPMVDQSATERVLPPKIRRKPNLQKVGKEGGEVSSDIENSIRGELGKGQSLAPDLQTKMGEAMGADFSQVKIHTDAASNSLNQSVQAKAFTTGNDVFFRQGAYDPSSRSGQELIAHELTHVVQQTGNVQRRTEHSHPISASQSGLIQRDDEEVVGDVDTSDFSDEAEKTFLGGTDPSLLEDPEMETTTKTSEGKVTTTETGTKAFAGCGTAAQKLVECDEFTMKEAFRALARAGAFGEAAAKKEIETSGGTKASVEGTASGFAGTEGEVVSVKIVDAIEGLTILARATAKAGVGFDLNGIAQVATQLPGGIELGAKLEAKLSGFAGVMAEAKGKFNINACGLAVEGKAYAMAGAKSEGEVTVAVNVGDLGLDAKAAFEGLAGAEAGAEGKLSVGLDGISASGKAECFAGAKIKGSAESSLTYRGVVLVKISGELEASAGVGAEISGEFTIKGGKLVIGGKLSAALGLGAGAGAKVEIDFKEIGKAIYQKIKEKLVAKALDNRSIADQDRTPSDDLTTEEQTTIEQDLYNAAYPHLKAYGDKKLKLAKSKNIFGNSKADRLVKLDKVQKIIDDKIRRNATLAEHLKYKFTDAVLQKACMDAFGDQLRPGGLYIQAGVIRAFDVKKPSEV